MIRRQERKGKWISKLKICGSERKRDLAHRRCDKAQQAACILIYQPQQPAIFRLDTLSRILLDPWPEHFTENLRLICARDKKNNLSRVIQDRESKRDAES